MLQVLSIAPSLSIYLRCRDKESVWYTWDAKSYLGQWPKIYIVFNVGSEMKTFFHAFFEFFVFTSGEKFMKGLLRRSHNSVYSYEVQQQKQQYITLKYFYFLCVCIELDLWYDRMNQFRKGCNAWISGWLNMAQIDSRTN